MATLLLVLALTLLAYGTGFVIRFYPKTNTSRIRSLIKIPILITALCLTALQAGLILELYALKETAGAVGLAVFNCIIVSGFVHTFRWPKSFGLNQYTSLYLLMALSIIVLWGFLIT